MRNRLQSQIRDYLCSGYRVGDRSRLLTARGDTVPSPVIDRIVEEAFEYLGQDAERRAKDALLDAMGGRLREVYWNDTKMHAAIDLFSRIVTAAVLGDVPLTDAERRDRMDMVENLTAAIPLLPEGP